MAKIKITHKKQLKKEKIYAPLNSQEDSLCSPSKKKKTMESKINEHIVILGKADIDGIDDKGHQYNRYVYISTNNRDDTYYVESGERIATHSPATFIEYLINEGEVEGILKK